MQENLVNLIPGSMVDDFFFFGFMGGIVSYAWYLFASQNEKQQNHIGFWVGLYGSFLSGCLGGLLAVAIDRAIEISSIVGLVNQVLYLAIIKSVKNGGIGKAIKEVVLLYLTGGRAK